MADTAPSNLPADPYEEMMRLHREAHRERRWISHWEVNHAMVARIAMHPITARDHSLKSILGRAFMGIPMRLKPDRGEATLTAIYAPPPERARL